MFFTAFGESQIQNLKAKGLGFNNDQPTYAQVFYFLRINHGIWINVFPENTSHSNVTWKSTIQKIQEAVSPSSHEVNFVKDFTGFYNEADAYSAALDYVLENLI